MLQPNWSPQGDALHVFYSLHILVTFCLLESFAQHIPTMRSINI